MLSAPMRVRPELERVFRPATTLFPSSRTMSGSFSCVAWAAATTPSAADQAAEEAMEVAGEEATEAGGEATEAEAMVVAAVGTEGVGTEGEEASEGATSSTTCSCRSRTGPRT